MHKYLAQVSWSGRNQSWIVKQKVWDPRLRRHKHDRFCSVRVPLGQSRALEYAHLLARDGQMRPHHMAVLRDADLVTP
jgi:hypothetical protein